MLCELLPPYLPDYNPIELAFSAIKYHLHCNGAYTWLAMMDLSDEEIYLTLLSALYSITPEDVWGWFMHCGYVNSFHCYFWNQYFVVWWSWMIVSVTWGFDQAMVSQHVLLFSLELELLEHPWRQAPRSARNMLPPEVVWKALGQLKYQRPLKVHASKHIGRLELTFK